MNLKELAQILGLSQTTVSRALNGYPEVSESTRARVLRAARQHNYSPNARAKGLATGQAMAIAHLLPLASRDEIMNPIFGDFVAGAAEVYNTRGYDMLIKVTGDDDPKEELRRLALKGSVDGLIVHAPRVDEPHLPILRDSGLPFVVHGRTANEAEGYSWIDVDNRRAFGRATDFLLDLGHRRIGLINGLETMEFARRRREGFEAALTRRGLSADPALLASSVMTEAFGYRTVRGCLALPDPPTAFLCSSLILAYGVRRAVDDAGLKMGRDVSVVTHDDDLGYFRNGNGTPVFTATRSSVRVAGRMAAELLLRLIENPDLGPQGEILQADLTVGRSTGPAPNSALARA